MSASGLMRPLIVVCPRPLLYLCMHIAAFSPGPRFRGMKGKDLEYWNTFTLGGFASRATKSQLSLEIKLVWELWQEITHAPSTTIRLQLPYVVQLAQG